MLKQFIKKFKSEKGQAVIELAITLPILTLILGGIIDFGWIFTNQSIIDHCAREGARYAVVNATGTGAITAIKNYTRSLAPTNIANSLDIDVTFTNTTFPRKGNVIVDVDGDIKVLTPIVGIFTKGQTINLNASCTMKVE